MAGVGLKDAVAAHARRLDGTRITGLVSGDPDRIADFSLQAGPLHACFARERIDRDALEAMFTALDAANARQSIKALFDGEVVNPTEARPALHTALRSDLSDAATARDAAGQARQARSLMAALVDRIRAAHITDVVSVGIGGSDLGPRLVVDALAGDASATGIRVHFLSNVDGSAAQRVLAGLDPAHTAAVLISKSFGTQETLLNGAILRDWLGDDARLFAVTANGQRARDAFDIPEDRILPMWDWVGGRYSLWSAVGLPIALAVGMPAFEALLAGAAELDAHVLGTPVRGNIAAWHAALAVWNRNGLGLGSHAVVPYDERLRLLPAYLQQLVMESLGKSAALGGGAVALETVPVWWGGVGTDTQHSFFQALHQGTQVVPIDFIGIARSTSPYPENQRVLLAHLLAQSEALANGQDADDPHRAYPGNRPNTVWLLDSLTPRALGALLAMFEHSVYLQALLWDVNPFDQFGVELGKQVAGRLLPALEGKGEADDPVTRALVGRLRG
ncbi:glucose-6-phosphate isomerase [Lysobacter sp. A3-1-A15]|uniref:glucose-6-phosphate isomerase n=1 Tax=Novilysobacter viscosus TaxID=3098602 RepID=UPI002EDBAECC